MKIGANDAPQFVDTIKSTLSSLPMVAEVNGLEMPKVKPASKETCVLEVANTFGPTIHSVFAAEERNTLALVFPVIGKLA